MIFVTELRSLPHYNVTENLKAIKIFASNGVVKAHARAKGNYGLQFEY